MRMGLMRGAPVIHAGFARLTLGLGVTVVYDPDRTDEDSRETERGTRDSTTHGDALTMRIRIRVLLKNYSNKNKIIFRAGNSG